MSMIPTVARVEKPEEKVSVENRDGEDAFARTSAFNEYRGGSARA